MLRDARERYDVPVVEVILPAARRAVAASRTGRVGVIGTRATVDSLVLRRRLRRGAARRAGHPGLPPVRRLRRARRHRRARADAGRARVPRPARRRRRRHPDPRVHPLPAAHGRDLPGDGRRRHARLQRRGVREGRLQAARAHRRHARGRRRRRTSSSPPDRPTSSRRPGGASWARSWRSRPTSPAAWEACHEAHVVGCSGSYPGPDSPASCYLRRGRRRRGAHLAAGPRHGQRRARRPAPLHRPADLDAVALSHLHADHCVDLTGLYVLGCYHPSGVRPTIPVWGPDGTAERINAAYNLPGSPDDRGLRLPHLGRGVPGRAFRGRPDAGGPPGRAPSPSG